MQYNVVEVLKAIGYSTSGVKGQKTRVLKSFLGIENASDTFMIDKQEMLTVLDGIAKSKSEKGLEAAKIFVQIEKGSHDEIYTKEYIEELKETTVTTKKASAKKGTLADYKEFAIASGLRAEFEKFMSEKYGEGTIVAPWDTAAD